ncbi:MAG TPA: CYTH domain-containing protein [Candidatus Salinicoccus stercoripullorum]|uniref:CYTH domain-containing protein n=1 Tax=Candidatus Salinicoccus stercoripullorum TaxID=2838756 RepID=A0A9D1TZD1_9STAP|nr:CYTH domain-containing protein [Candidatus Salinicoccus stercoripullorum]
MKELEIEFKNMLSGQEYGRLEEKYFSSQKPVVQTNFYIDTPDLDMRKNRILLRIRDAEGIQMMTLKEPTEKGVMEYHGEVSGELNFDRDIRPAELPELIRGELARYDIDISRLKIYGALSTERRQVPYREGLLVLDRNTFLDEEDFELEYEVDNHDKGETRFLQLLEEAGIERRGEVTKSERFYNKLASIRTGDHYAYTI